MLFVVVFLLFTAHAFCADRECTSPIIEADLLYWKAHEEGMAFAVKTHGVNASKRDLKEPAFEWDFGFKLAVGCHFAPREWDILLKLTHFHTHADSLIHAKTDILYPMWIQISANAPRFADKIKMHWRLHLAFIDALAKKLYFPHSSLSIYPQIGLRYAIVRQKFNMNYMGGMFTGSEEDLSMKNKFWGVGPYGSLGIEWGFARHFSLCATGGFSALWGQFYLHQNEDVTQGHTQIVGIRDVFFRIASIADVNLALRWQKRWKKSNRRLNVQLGWDNVLLFKQNRYKRIIGSEAVDDPGNLGLQGFEWGIGFDF